MTRQSPILFIAFILLPLSIFSQDIVNYDLTSRNSFYTPLENGELALPSDQDFLDDNTFNISAGFDFEMLGIAGTGIRNFFALEIITVSEINFAMLDSLDIVPLMFVNNPQFQNRAIISGNDPSLVRYETVGDPGERIFKLEYANMGFLIEADSLGSLDLFSNMQVWVYEGSNCFEIRYGPNNVTDADDFIFGETSGQFAGLTASTVSQLFGGSVLPYGIFADGDVLNPTENEIINEKIGEDFVTPTLTGLPPNGLVYTFCSEGIAPPVSTKNVLSNLDWEVYPNPVEQTLTLDFKNLDQGNYEIISIDGVVIKSGQVRLGQSQVDVMALPSGHYVTKVLTSDGFAVKRFFKAGVNY